MDQDYSAPTDEWVEGTDIGVTALVSCSPCRPLPSSPNPDVLAQILGNHLPIGPRRRHLADKPLDRRREFPLPLSRQDLADLPPAPLDMSPGLDHGLLTRLSSEPSAQDVPADLFYACASTPGLSALLGSVDPIELG